MLWLNADCTDGFINAAYCEFRRLNKSLVYAILYGNYQAYLAGNDFFETYCAGGEL